jgi:hypothetical protein
MKTGKNVLFFMLLGLCAAAVSAQTEADFQTEANDDGGISITKYTGWTADITIPAKIGGKAVTIIKSNAFENCDLTGVTIPDSVTTIEMLAFQGNKLTKLNIGKGVSIQRLAFYRNTQLSKVTLGANCDFSDSEGFGYFADYNYMCNGRQAGTYTIDAVWDKNWASQRQADYEKVKKTAEGFIYAETPYGLAIAGYTGDSKRLSIPDKLNGKPVKYIGRLYYLGLTGVRIPDSIVCIGARAFENNNLTNVVIPNNVSYIGAGAFDSNHSLESVTIGSSVVFIGDGALPRNLKSITIPANVSSGENAFKEVYENNGKMAGTYTEVNYNEWTFEAR